MRIILLSGGSGKRLWPLSNDVRSKQFLKLLKDENGVHQSMVQRVYGQIQKTFSGAEITIATNVTQIDSIRSQLPEDIEIVVEPERRNTFPAIALSCAFLAFEKRIALDETVIVLPIDSYTDDSFFVRAASLAAPIRNGAADIALIGILPAFPTSKYGYIVPEEHEIMYGVRAASRFVEKPDEQTALELIESGALWNGGVFAFRLGYMVDVLKNEIPYSDFEKIRDNYGLLEKTSFDYKVVEKAKRVAVAEYEGEWSDIGTWRTLTDKVEKGSTGNVLLEKSENTYVVNELSIPIITLGVKDMVIAASPDGILVSDLEQSSHMKPVVDKLENARPMYEDRRWGSYSVIAKNPCSLTKILTIASGKQISYQKHAKRDEIWVIASGHGYFVLDGMEQAVKSGDTLNIRHGQWHSIKAAEEMRIVEVQLGSAFDEDDIERGAYIWKANECEPKRDPCAPWLTENERGG